MLFLTAPSDPREDRDRSNRGVAAFWYFVGGDKFLKLRKSFLTVGVKFLPSSSLKKGDLLLRSTNDALIAPAAALIVADTIGFLRRPQILPSSWNSDSLYLEKNALTITCSSSWGRSSRRGLMLSSNFSLQYDTQRRHIRSRNSFVDSWTESMIILAFALPASRRRLLLAEGDKAENLLELTGG